MIRPDGLAVVLEVKNDIPYLTKSRQHRDPGTQTKTKELCGVSSFDDVVRITLPQRNESSSEAAPASAIIGSSPEADADAVSEAAESVHSLVPRDCSSERGSEIGDYPEAETSTEEKPKKNVIETLRENVPGPQRDLDDALREFDYHCLTRKPSRHRECEACMIGKTRSRRKLTGSFKRDVRDFGDLITMDRIHMKDILGRPGMGGSTDALSIYDVAAGYRHCAPVNSKDVDTTIRALQHMLGNDTVGLVYSDNHPSLRAECRELGIAWEGSQLGIHQSNAIIERFNADVLAGTRTLLVQAGLPSA